MKMEGIVHVTAACHLHEPSLDRPNNVVDGVSNIVDVFGIETSLLEVSLMSIQLYLGCPRTMEILPFLVR